MYHSRRPDLYYFKNINMKTIRVHCNVIYEGWSADHLETGIGGSEEKLIEWAREMSKKYDVTIYHNGDHGDFDGVKYRDYAEFKPWEYSDVFISFKNRGILLETINAGKIYHWTADIETWDQLAPERIICISDWHKRNMLPKGYPFETMYLWADFERLDKNKVEKESNTMIYTSSYDRGLEYLLKNWGKTKENLKLDKLYITYGWDFIDRANKSNPQAQTWKDSMIELMKQDGIEVLGRLTNDELCKYYWKSEYWVNPVTDPRYELFCISAVKAQYCESIPVVIRAGGLKETVNKYIDIEKLINKNINDSDESWIVENKKFVTKFDMKKQIQLWIDMIEG